MHLQSEGKSISAIAKTLHSGGTVRTEKKVTIIAVSLSRFRFSYILADMLRLPLRELPSLSRFLVWLLTFSD